MPRCASRPANWSLLVLIDYQSHLRNWSLLVLIDYQNHLRTLLKLSSCFVLLSVFIYKHYYCRPGLDSSNGESKKMVWLDHVT